MPRRPLAFCDCVLVEAARRFSDPTCPRHLQISCSLLIRTMSRPGRAWPSSLRGGLPGTSLHPRNPERGHTNRDTSDLFALQNEITLVKRFRRREANSDFFRIGSIALSLPWLTTRPDPCCVREHVENDRPHIVPLYAARIADLGPGDFVKIDCGACSHTALVTPAFLSRLGLEQHRKVLDLRDRVRCRVVVLGGGRSCRSSGPSDLLSTVL